MNIVWFAAFFFGMVFGPAALVWVHDRIAHRRDVQWTAEDDHQFEWACWEYQEGLR